MSSVEQVWDVVCNFVVSVSGHETVFAFIKKNTTHNEMICNYLQSDRKQYGNGRIVSQRKWYRGWSPWAEDSNSNSNSNSNSKTSTHWLDPETDDNGNLFYDEEVVTRQLRKRDIITDFVSNVETFGWACTIEQYLPSFYERIELFRDMLKVVCHPG
jgi:hypothetical protein